MTRVQVFKLNLRGFSVVPAEITTLIISWRRLRFAFAAFRNQTAVIGEPVRTSLALAEALRAGQTPCVTLRDGALDVAEEGSGELILIKPSPIARLNRRWLRSRIEKKLPQGAILSLDFGGFVVVQEN